MKPTKSQEKALSKLTEFSQSFQERAFVLHGSAGVGKTFIIKEFIEQSELKIKVTATTHKACKVLKNRVGVEVSTIHSFLALSPKKVRAEFLLKQNTRKYKANIKNIDLVVIDEASMIGEDLLSYVLDDIEKYGRKYLFIGDFCQIPPVGETFSPVKEIQDDGYELTEIIRQSRDNPIITFATSMRDSINGDTKIPPKLIMKDGFGIKKLTRDEWEKELLKQDFRTEDNVKVLSWTNRNSQYYNKFVNTNILGVDKNLPFERGSRIQFNTAYIIGEDVIKNTGDEGIVHSVKLRSDKRGFDYFDVRLKNDENSYRVIDDRKLNEYHKYCTRLLEKAKNGKGEWVDYYSFMERFCDIRSTHSQTCHKSQGSTFNTVFVDFYDIMKNTDRAEARKLLYTAVTRATTKVFLTGENY